MLKVSIITAAFNSGKTIGETIQSVANQSYPQVEHIIIDGKSTDKTIEIIESLKHPKLIYRSEKDSGIYDALNKGIRLATGDLIGVIGSDDYYPQQNVIERVVESFEKKDTDSLYGDMHYVNDKKEVVRFWKDGEYKESNFLKGWMPHHLTFYLKKEIYLKYGLYNTDFKLGGDYELLLRMLYKHKVSTQYLPEVLVTMRIGGASTKNIKNRIKANLEDRKAWVINGLRPRFYTLYFKPLLKIPQFFKKQG